MSKQHDLKTWRDAFEAVRDGRKTFEFRRDDRGFCVGDTLELREWDPYHYTATGNGEYTRRALRATVSYVLHGGRFGIPEGYVVMSLADVVEL